MQTTQSSKAGERTHIHPLKAGDIVDVKNTTLGGAEIIEGRATIVSAVRRGQTDHHYNVRFHGDGHRMTYERFVLPEQKIEAEEAGNVSEGPRVGKYGKAVVVKSVDPAFRKFAVIRPFCGTIWRDTEAEAQRICDEYNAREIPQT